jgi:Leucine-rich repeat (LRR) protein
VSDHDLVKHLAKGRPVVDLRHARERTEGVIGAMWRGGAVAALCAHRCKLSALPSLVGFEQLERLDVGDNELTELPPLPSSLRELYVYDNRLSRLPALPPLSVLDVNRNRLERLPPLANLDFVYAAANALTSLPSISGVRYLNVSANPFERIELDDAAIEELRIENARLQSISWIGQLPSLRELSLRGNQLDALPDTIGSLAGLRVLDLRSNRLDSLPGAVRTLTFHKLDLRWNPLRDRPAWLGELAAQGAIVYI